MFSLRVVRFTDAILRDAKNLTCAGIAKRRVAFVFTVVGMFALGIPIALSPNAISQEKSSASGSVESFKLLNR